MKEDTFSSDDQQYIICVDDDQSVLNQLAVQLEEAFGDICTIEYTESAEEALVLIEEIDGEGGNILLVISDQVMPGMKGDRFLEEVNTRLPNAHKILLTGYAGLESALYAINRAGLDKYLEKPWDKNEFLATVQNLLSQTVETTVSQGVFRIKDTIQNIQIFRDLSPEAINLIAEKLHLVKFEKNSTIFTIDDPGDCMYIIKSGEVKIIAGVDESGEVLAYLGRGSYFGEMALLTGEPRSASVVTAMDSQLFILTKQDFDYLLSTHPSIALTLSHVLSQRLRSVSIKKAGRQNKIICMLNSIPSERGKLISIAIARKLLKETNGKVVVIDLDTSGTPLSSIVSVDWESKSSNWIVENLDNIQESELSQLLPEDSEGIKFFIPPTKAVNSPSAYVVQLLSLFKEFYNFILINLSTEGEPEDTAVKMIEQADSALYLLEQSARFSEDNVRFLQTIHREHSQLMKKIDIIVVRDTPNPSVTESLSGLVEYHHVHYLRLDGDSVQFLFKQERGAKTSVGAGKDPQVNRDVSRIARRLGNVSVGLVLGGGGARAYAHLGVLKVLQEEGIPIDIIAGTSMGAFIGALHIMGKSVAEILEISRENWRKLNSPISWSLPRIAFVKGKRIHNLVHDIFGDVLIEDLPLPFFCVAGDLISGQEVVLGQGKLYKAILATGALPGFFEPVRMGDMYLVDGGVVNNVPGDLLKKQGIEMVIAVDVTPAREVRLIPAMDTRTNSDRSQNIFRRVLEYGKRLKSRYGTILLPRIIMRVIAIEGLEITRNKSQYFDIHIQPNLEDFDLFDFRRLHQIVDIGEQAGRQEIGKIRETMNSLKR